MNDPRLKALYAQRDEHDRLAEEHYKLYHEQQVLWHDVDARIAERKLELRAELGMPEPYKITGEQISAQRHADEELLEALRNEYHEEED